MLDTLYNYLFSGSLIYLSLLLFPYLFRSVVGPNFFDRILSINSISTIIIIIICVISLLQEEHYIVDVALVYAMLGFVTVVIVSKAYLRSHKKDREHDFENITGVEEGETHD